MAAHCASLSQNPFAMIQAPIFLESLFAAKIKALIEFSLMFSHR
jgi:hypothetical protein